ncbi:hydrogenase, Fe-only [Desulfurobacterium thermolithotrophum DSM 11699]|uniref:Hydrogenase, Fe-only n=1 Tax=Desulfurobacterium thermolithotrophum (strain DSM 11699 / BSA) TaxID=868864 RepID=F0S0Z3_DESTD|nr:[Fe-Fe] hydrogenase large subunit C-terminal domain-containing protein [Desulfurobacterium thermolithotrophum]ADY72797.1 hydrogenase, Fe-only [Desulfurobacterium thermolithotrophum DSM 11699]
MDNKVSRVATFPPPPDARVKGHSPLGTYRPGELKGIVRINQDKCVGCDTCKGHCPADAIKGGLGVAHSVDIMRCINCGQCLVNCPFGAIEQMSFVDEVAKKLSDPEVTVVALIAPAVRVAIAEEFGAPPGTLTVGRLHNALKKLGFKIYETNLAADQTIMEEGFEFIAKVRYWLLGERDEELKEIAHHPLPHFTSCCPGWIRYAEIYYPQLLPHISGAKSPQQMAGASAKTWAALNIWNVDPRKVYTVGIMPCTAKIFEASRPEFKSAWEFLKEKGSIPEDTPPFPDVDAVLTTRDLATLFKMKGINPLELPEKEKEEEPGEIYTGAATIFGNSGGVMEAALRTTYYVLSGKKPPNWNIYGVRGHTTGLKEMEIPIPLKSGETIRIRVAVVNGIKNHLDKIVEDVIKGTSPYHFIEVMNCPGGCINGGGQPINPMGTSWIDPLLPLRLKA